MPKFRKKGYHAGKIEELSGDHFTFGKVGWVDWWALGLLVIS